MTTLLFSLALIVLTVALIAMSMAVKRLSKDIDELKEVVRYIRIKVKYLDFYQLSDHEQRLDQLEEALDLKEYFDKEALNEEENINN